MQLKPFDDTRQHPDLTIAVDADGDLVIRATFADGEAIDLAYFMKGKIFLFTLRLDQQEKLEPYFKFTSNRVETSF